MEQNITNFSQIFDAFKNIDKKITKKINIYLIG